MTRELYEYYFALVLLHFDECCRKRKIMEFGRLLYRDFLIWSV